LDRNASLLVVPSAPEEPQLAFSDERAWERWLAENHQTASGVWIAIAKKGSGIESVGYPEVLDSAICFGWIDARRQRLDETRFRQRFTPRRAASRWSRINREKAEALIASGRMRPAGLTEVERAKSDGRWEAAYEGQRTATVPEDLALALQRSPAAARQFEKLSSQNRYAILYRLQDARRAETRTRRLAKFIAMLEAGETIHPQ
jgi:uncharacterized protein YdeI (YjbR/CyaY-like superfamily)